MDGIIKNDICDFNNLHKAMRKCRKGVSWKDSVARYTNNGLASIARLCSMLEDDSYTIDDYFKFTIHEPKTRNIVSTKFKDRVFQRSMCDQYLYEAITRGFIYDNGACQLNRGNDFSRERLKVHLRKYYNKHGSDGYVLKVDFKNYFGSTPHGTIKKVLDIVLDDEWVSDKVFDIIDSYNEGDRTGVGLGSQVSQLEQLLVLNGLDHYMKEKLHVRHYLRYMDDIVIIHNDKEFLKECLIHIIEYVADIGLKLNDKKTQIFPLKHRINFLGFRFGLSVTGTVFCTIDKNNVKKYKRQLRRYRILVEEEQMSREEVDDCYVAWKAHAGKGNSFHVVQNMNRYYKELWRA